MATTLPVPSLPQTNTQPQQQARLAQLRQQQGLYLYDFNSRLAPVGVAVQLPPGEGFSLVWWDAVISTFVQLGGNVLALASKALGVFGGDTPNTSNLSSLELQQARSVYADLAQGFQRLTEKAARMHQFAAVAPSVAAPEQWPVTLQSVVHRVEEATTVIEASVDAVTKTATDVVVAEMTNRSILDASIVQDLLDCIEHLLKTLLSDAFHALLKSMGLYGPARSVEQFQEQFAVVLAPSIVSTYADDLMFARMRLAGPNPVIIQAVKTLPANFPVTEAQFQAVMGRDDTLVRAGAEGRLLLADYAALSKLAQQVSAAGKGKYLSAPLALFAVPAAPQVDRRLRPVAIQCSQTPGLANPVFTPQEGLAWHLAQVQVQVADGNYHELVSHLGLTHLVIEQFAMATPRQLPIEHPLYQLLTPHFQGTLAINNSAKEHLVAPGGAVDLLLAAPIQDSARFSAQAVLNRSINASFLPKDLAARGVDDVNALPDYPYRDDGLLLWNNIHDWVKNYLALYYNGDDSAVLNDTELQAWIHELADPQGGNLKDIGENGSIQTFAYLVDLITYVIFTASVQHATVNFPQRTIMGFTPALPLAAYAPAPTMMDPALLTHQRAMKSLPPLEMAIRQLLFGFGLGGVYFTRLGDYDQYRRSPWFPDARVGPVLEGFQRTLRQTEQEIGRRNLSRIPYETLLPSAIPQSINI